MSSHTCRKLEELVGTANSLKHCYSGSDFCGGRVDVQKREYCTLTDEKCRREFLLQDFDKSDSLVCVPFHSCCDNCVSKSLIDNCMMVS